MEQKHHDKQAELPGKVFLDQTDHLTDSPLEELLYGETLHEAAPEVPVDSRAFSTTDLVEAQDSNEESSPVAPHVGTFADQMPIEEDDLDVKPPIDDIS